MKTIAFVLALLCASIAQAHYPSCNPYYRAAYATTNVNVPPLNWQSELAGAVRLRDDRSAFLQALGALGYTYNSQTGYQPTGSQYGSSYSQQTAPQGNSVYGYNETTQLYGNLDLGALYEGARRLTSDAQQYGANAMAGHSALVGQAGDQAARVAEINAKKDYAVASITAAGQASKPSDSATITRQQYGSNVVAPGPQQPAQPFAVDQLPPSIQKCAVCHIKEQRLPINLAMTPPQRLDAIGRLMLPAGEKGHMPKDAELTPEEMSEAVAWLSGRK